MNCVLLRSAVLILHGWLTGLVRAADDVVDKPPPDKSGYNLLNPTPEDAMRELSPNRPDKTESPYTLDAGHFMMEMDFVTYTHDDTDGVRTEAWNVAPVNLKVGLLNNVDLQFIYDNYVHVRTADGLGITTTQFRVWGPDTETEDQPVGKRRRANRVRVVAVR